MVIVPLTKLVAFFLLLLAGCEKLPEKECSDSYWKATRVMRQSVIQGTQKAFPGYQIVSVMNNGYNPSKTLECGLMTSDLFSHTEFILLRRENEDYVAHVTYSGVNQVKVQDVEKLRPKREECHRVNRPQNGGNHWVKSCQRIYE